VGPTWLLITIKERLEHRAYMPYSGFDGWVAAGSEVWAALGCSTGKK